jgi:hypothetical protein
MPALYVKQAGDWKQISQNGSFPFLATLWVKRAGTWRQCNHSQLSGGNVGLWIKEPFVGWTPLDGS